MKKFVYFIAAGFAGAILAAIVMVLLMPGMMIREHASPFRFEETVEKIKTAAENEGWVVSGISDLSASVKKHGNHDLSDVKLVNMCQADHAFKILNEDANKKISVFMPCTISVYRKSDGKVYVGSMNAGLLGKMFGGTVAEVMGNTVAAQQQKFIAFLN